MTEIGNFTPTTIFILSVCLIVIIYDIVAYKVKRLQTISVVMRGWSYYNPAIPFLAGMLMGHWFW